jgi:hypothetical protein
VTGAAPIRARTLVPILILILILMVVLVLVLVATGDSVLDPHAAKLAAKQDIASKPPVVQFVIMEHAMAASLVARVHADIQVRCRSRATRCRRRHCH